MRQAIIFILILLQHALVNAQDCSTLVSEGFSYEEPVAAYYNHIMEMQDSVKADSIQKAWKSLTDEERHKQGNEYEAYRETFKIRTIESKPIRIDINKGGMFEPIGMFFDFWSAKLVKDTGKVYLDILELRNCAWKSNYSFFHSYFDLLFTDGQTIRSEMPFCTPYDLSDVFIVLDGSINVLRFDEKGKPTGVQAMPGNTKLLKKLMMVPLKQVKMYVMRDKRYQEYYDYVLDGKFVEKGTIDVPPNKANEIMQALNCIVKHQ